MLISCKCLNFIATSQHKSTAPGATADAAAAANESGNESAKVVLAALMQAFLQKYPRNFIFYSQCMDFLKQSIGPIPDLSINAINQRDLVYSITLDIAQQSMQTWQLSICVNCNTTLCAKQLQDTAANTSSNPPQYLINCSLLTNNDELAQRRADKSFSETFGLLIMNHPELGSTSPGTGTLNGGVNFSIGSLSSSSLNSLDSKQQRLRQLQQHMQQRLKREIAETDERIQRYTEQQFAMLRSFREKSEQEYEQLVQLLQRVPEQQTGEFLDRAPPALEVSGGVSYAGRRRNTIGSRRDLNGVTAATTPTTPNAPAGGFNMLLALPVATVATTETNTQVGAAGTMATITAVVNRKMSNFDTPPATPEATPMSVGNSPTFRQQQQQQQQQPPQLPPQLIGRLGHSVSFQQQFPTPTVEEADDCLFELEGVDAGAAPVSTMSLSFNLPPQLQQHHPPHQFQRSLSNHQQQHESNMSDLDESDAEEAEDALDLDSSMPIPMNAAGRRPITSAQMMNFAKSLPIEIANSPMAERSYIGESDEDELDNTVDIAASIKALAKSVHGEAVFGDLPRPRLRSQI